MSSPDLNICGFEAGNNGEFGVTSGTFSVQSGTVRTGTFALRTNPTTTAVGWVEIATYDATGTIAAFNLANVWYRFYFRYATKAAAADEDIASPTSSGQVVKGYLRLNSAGKLAFYNQGVVLQATGNTVLNANQWYRIELKCGSGSGGHFEVLIDGVTEIPDQAVSGTLGNNNASLLLGKIINHNGNTVDYFYDDVAISSTAYPGAGQCSVAVPSADGTFTAWLIGAGSLPKWGLIKEIPNDGATTFLKSTLVVGDAYTGLINANAVISVNAIVNMVKAVYFTDGTGTASLKYRLRSSGTNFDGNPRTPLGAFGAADCLLFLTDPHTGASWQAGNMTALEAGVVENATTNQSNITAAYLMVDYTPASGSMGLLPDSWMPDATSQMLPLAHTKIELVNY